MTIDEAIGMMEELAENNRQLCKANDPYNFHQPVWKQSVEDFSQLAEWLKELKVKEEINQSLLYENERLIKSVQEIRAEIEKERKNTSMSVFERFEGLCWAISVIDKHMSWEGEECR